jgi:predicted nucleotidyltransferase
VNVAAFSHVFENLLGVQIRPDLIIPVASLPGLIVIKLFAWLDRHEGRDVQDIRRLIETYTDAGNLNRLYEEEADELERVGFDTILAGAFSWGKTRSESPTRMCELGFRPHSRVRNFCAGTSIRPHDERLG